MGGRTKGLTIWLTERYGRDREAMSGEFWRARSRQLAKRRHVPATCFTLIHLGLGEKEPALDWLETGARGRETSLAGLKVHPAYDELRGESRFQALLRKLGMAGAAVSEAC